MGCSAVVEIGAQAGLPPRKSRRDLLRRCEAVLVTGVYGAGKSTVVADIGKLRTDRGERARGRLVAGSTRRGTQPRTGEW